MQISIHALREEGDKYAAWRKFYLAEFLSTPSARRATVEETPFTLRLLDISIHALREEGDSDIIRNAIVYYSISIHALREEGDLPRLMYNLELMKFLSTPSARRATRLWKQHSPNRGISIHALREEGDLMGQNDSTFWAISIHALREEGDSKNRDKISIFL